MPFCDWLQWNISQGCLLCFPSQYKQSFFIPLTQVHYEEGLAWPIECGKPSVIACCPSWITHFYIPESITEILAIRNTNSDILAQKKWRQNTPDTDLLLMTIKCQMTRVHEPSDLVRILQDTTDYSKFLLCEISFSC